MEGMRLNKYLATHGYCSRREADRLIEEGKVHVNGRKATLGQHVTDNDTVRVLGRSKKEVPPKSYILLNKPVGYIVTTDKKKKDNVLDLIDVEERVFPVGRLDVESSGLLLLTNDGTLADRLMHPRYEHEKEYVVTVDKPLMPIDLGRMRNGMMLDDGPTNPAKVRRMDAHRFAIILKEGRNRQIRRMCKELGYEVTSLKRTRINTLKLGQYPIGRARRLTYGEVRDLMRSVGLETDLKPPKQFRRRRPMKKR